jgi:Ran GTPase-activating protein (RanGAP) involved in mRNA processing and transport
MSQSYFTFPNIDEENVWSIATISKNIITRLEIYIRSATSTDLKQLLTSLPHTMEYLHFSLCYLDSDISQTLVDCLSNHPSTQSFEMNKYRKIGVEEMYFISTLLSLPNVEKFEISSNYIGIEQTRIFAQALGNSTLKELIFSWNSIGDGGVSNLAQALEANHSLRILDCGMNGISSKGFYPLAETLKINSTLLEIQLHWNNLGSQGAELLAQVIKQNKSLVRIFIPRNKIGDIGVDAIADALQYNDTLEMIDLRYNGISKQGLRYLRDSFQKNKTLRQMDLDETCDKDIFKILTRDIQQLLKRNERILQSQCKITGIQIFETFAQRLHKDIEYYLLPSLIFPMIGLSSMKIL